MTDMDPRTKQLITDARKRAVDLLQKPIAEFFAGEAVRDVNPTDSVLGLTSCIAEAVAVNVKILDLQRETSANKELAEILGESFQRAILAALNAIDNTIKERTS